MADHNPFFGDRSIINPFTPLPESESTMYIACFFRKTKHYLDEDHFKNWWWILEKRVPGFFYQNLLPVQQDRKID